MMSNGIIAAGAHASAVGCAARWVAKEDTRSRRRWHDMTEEVAPADASPHARLRGLLTWGVDRLIMVGDWLKARAGEPRYQRA